MNLGDKKRPCIHKIVQAVLVLQVNQHRTKNTMLHNRSRVHPELFRLPSNFSSTTAHHLKPFGAGFAPIFLRAITVPHH